MYRSWTDGTLCSLKLKWKKIINSLSLINPMLPTLIHYNKPQNLCGIHTFSCDALTLFEDVICKDKMVHLESYNLIKIWNIVWPLSGSKDWRKKTGTNINTNSEIHTRTRVDNIREVQAQHDQCTNQKGNRLGDPRYVLWT